MPVCLLVVIDDPTDLLPPKAIQRMATTRRKFEWETSVSKGLVVVALVGMKSPIYGAPDFLSHGSPDSYVTQVFWKEQFCFWEQVVPQNDSFWGAASHSPITVFEYL